MTTRQLWFIIGAQIAPNIVGAATSLILLWHSRRKALRER